MIEDASASSVGLCATCTHVQRVISDRGAVFYLCTLSAVDPRFPKYPRLPVLSCAGYEKRSEESEPKLKPELNSGRAPRAGRSCEKERDRARRSPWDSL
jgi:hypothetical protein